jgi:hypothetical protein
MQHTTYRQPSRLLLFAVLTLLALSACAVSASDDDPGDDDSALDADLAKGAVSPDRLAKTVLNDKAKLATRLKAFGTLRTASPQLFGETVETLSTRPTVVADALSLFSVAPHSANTIEKLAAYQRGDKEGWLRIVADANPMSDRLKANLEVIQKYSAMRVVYEGWRLFGADVPNAVAIAGRIRDAFYGGLPAPWSISREQVFFDEVFNSAFIAQPGSELRAFQLKLALDEYGLLLYRRGPQFQPFTPTQFDWSIDGRLLHYCGQVSALVTPTTSQGLANLLGAYDYILISDCRDLFFEIIRATPLAKSAPVFEQTIGRYRGYRERGFGTATDYFDASAVVLIQKAMSVPAAERAHVFDAMLQSHAERYRGTDWDGQTFHAICFNRIRDVLAVLPGLTPAQITAISRGEMQVPRLPGITPQWPIWQQ